MKKVQNKGDIGNPYHADDGTFTSPSDDLSISKTESVESEPVKAEDTSFVIAPFNPDNADDWLSLFEDSPSEKAESLIEASQPYSTLLNLGKVRGSTTLEDRKAFLENSINEYDKKKIANLTENEINALTIAEKAVVAEMVAKQNLEVLNNKKAELLDKQNKEIFEKVDIAITGSKAAWSGIWQMTPSVINFNDYYKKDDIGTSRIDRKREYYQDNIKKIEGFMAEQQAIIDDPFSFEDDVDDAKINIKNQQDAINYAKTKLAQLDDFEQTGLKYLEVKNQIEQSYLPQIEGLESQIGQATKELEKLNTPDFNEFVIKSKDLISAYQDETAIYSKARKDKAIWFKGYNVIAQAEKHFFPTAEKHYASMTPDEVKRIDDYKTGSSKYNEPLRSLNYTGYKDFQGASYSKAINDLTNAIDKCTWPDDIWVQRGQSPHINCFNLNGVKKSISSMTEAERQSLVGSTYVDNGFYSAGAGKGTGFTGQGMIINTYCPKGTKMVYAQYRPGYKNENEMIIQRGYSYRITKIEYKGGKYYMDVEVLLNSDKNKPVGSDLEDIAKKHYKGG